MLTAQFMMASVALEIENDRSRLFPLLGSPLVSEIKVKKDDLYARYLSNTM